MSVWLLSVQHPTDNLYDIQKIWLRSFVIILPAVLFIPRPHSDCHRRIYHIKSTNYIQDEKNLYFIYYFISLLLWRDTALIFYCIDVVTRKD